VINRAAAAVAVIIGRALRCTIFPPNGSLADRQKQV
jgi:hypothetical protein